MSRPKDELTSGFVRLDFLLTFTVASAGARRRIEALCEQDGYGTRVGEATWELATPLSPAELEGALAPLLEAGDRAVFYYLADSKRLFRIVVSG